MATKSEYSRRDFLKIVGAGSGIAAAGCSRELPEQIIPYVVQPDEVVPGVSTWYAGSCGGCTSGCGVLVRTREGRAVKVEGNPSHPINQGGLCAQGQATLHALYNPDRVREPLIREANGAFKTVSWEEALGEIAKGFKTLGENKSAVLLTKPLSGSSSLSWRYAII